MHKCARMRDEKTIIMYMKGRILSSYLFSFVSRVTFIDIGRKASLVILLKKKKRITDFYSDRSFFFHSASSKSRRNKTPNGYFDKVVSVNISKISDYVK